VKASGRQFGAGKRNQTGRERIQDVVDLVTAPSQPSHHITVHNVEELTPRILHIGGNFFRKLLFDFFEFLFDFGVGAAPLHRLDHLALEVDAAFDDAKNAVTGPEHTGKQAELFVEKS
jgi:hypothetical protein